MTDNPRLEDERCGRDQHILHCVERSGSSLLAVRIRANVLDTSRPYKPTVRDLP